jgi:hypothetical protein
MHACHKLFLGTAALLSVVSLSHAATFVPVTPPSGATQTIVFGINKHAVITGAYIDANGVSHGFFGPLNGNYTSFDYGGSSTGTTPRAIDDDGNITGFADDPNFSVGREFLREKGGILKPIKKDGLPLDGVAQGIIKVAELSTGDYVDPNTGYRTGYLAKDGRYLSDVTLNLDVLTTNPRALNKHGTLAGFYLENDGATTHGLILRSGVIEIIDADDSGTTVLEGINQKELTAGWVTDASGEPHAFAYDNRKGEFTSIDIPDGSPGQQAWGVNDKGQIAVSTNSGNSFVYCIKDVVCPNDAMSVADGRSWKVKRGAPLHFDTEGRTGAKASPHATHGARP